MGATDTSVVTEGSEAVNLKIPMYLSGNTVKVKCVSKVVAKINRIKAASLDKLMVISDFDATLSKHHTKSDPTTRLPSTFGVLEQDTGLPAEAQKICQDNYKKYYPIEMDTTISEDEKRKHMINWWTSSQAAIVGAGSITKDCITDAVIKSPICLRDNSAEMLKFCKEKKVPFLVFSAGCGDIIDSQLKYKEPICWSEENMMLVSNMLGFHEDTGILKEFRKPLIHTLNKQGFVKRIKEFGTESGDRIDEMVSARSNVIVMGDHLGDLRMSEGMDNIDDALTIGFLNYNFEKNLQPYMDAFDVVLVDDESMDVPNLILKDLNNE